MNHTIKGIIIVVITSMLFVGASMFPIMQNSFAQRTKPTDDGLIIKSADERQAEGNTNTNTNTNTNSATSDSDSTVTADNTNNVTNSATASNSQSQDACAVAVTCPEGSTTVRPPPPPPPPTTGTLIVSKLCDPSCPGATFHIEILGGGQPNSFFLNSGQSQDVIFIGDHDFSVFEVQQPGFGGETGEGDCAGTISAGQTLHCTITNHPTT